MENIFEVWAQKLAVQMFLYKKLLTSLNGALLFLSLHESDSSHVALEDLRKIDEVKEVYLAHGAYDLIAKVSGESFDHLREIVHITNKKPKQHQINADSNTNLRIRQQHCNLDVCAELPSNQQKTSPVSLIYK